MVVINKIITWIKKLFHRPKKLYVNIEPTIYKMGGGWGDCIEWVDIKTGEVTGWKTPLPMEGDILLVPMKSGKIGKYVFTHIKRCGDPKDMFFATIRFWEYADEKILCEA